MALGTSHPGKELAKKKKKKKNKGQDVAIEHAYIVTDGTTADIGTVVPDLDIVLDGLVVADVCSVGLALGGQVGLAEEIEGRRACNVELLEIGACGNEDVVWDSVVWDGENGGLDAAERGTGVIEADVDGAIGTALEGVGRLLLAFGKGGRRIGCGGVVVCQDCGGGARQEHESRRPGRRGADHREWIGPPGLALFKTVLIE